MRRPIPTPRPLEPERTRPTRVLGWPKRYPALLLILGPLCGCMFQRSQPGLLIATTPPGARLYMDGADSGFVTPAWIEVPSNNWHRLDVSLAGYQPQSRLVGPHKQVQAVSWTKGWTGVHTWWFPILLPAQDFFIPVRVDDGLAPRRVHIQLDLVE